MIRKKRALLTLLVSIGLVFNSCAQENGKIADKKIDTLKMSEKIELSDEEWKAKLSPEQYNICRGKGTERAFTGKYYATKDKGTYKCAACENPLFSSDTKYDSGSGWPSFYAPLDNSNISMIKDKSHGMIRTEVVCSKCGSHLGHVFDDGPKPTGMRYCINSGSLDLEKK